MAQWENEIVQSTLVKRHSARLLLEVLEVQKLCLFLRNVPCGAQCQTGICKAKGSIHHRRPNEWKQITVIALDGLAKLILTRQVPARVYMAS